MYRLGLDFPHPWFVGNPHRLIANFIGAVYILYPFSCKTYWVSVRPDAFNNGNYNAPKPIAPFAFDPHWASS